TLLSHLPSHPHIYPLSLHDALPIWAPDAESQANASDGCGAERTQGAQRTADAVHRYDASDGCGAERTQGSSDAGPSEPRARNGRSEEHTSELQSLTNLVCRLLLEKK